MENIQNNFSYWKKCSTCKKEIPFGAIYYQCSVSTCQSGRTALRFCSVECWDAHLGFARHRESTADEMRAPSKQEYMAETESVSSDSVPAPVKRIIASVPSILRTGGTEAARKGVYDVETLIVVSKVKQLIRERSEFNTSQCCIDALTRKVVDECLKGMENARAAGRKTVMGRDIEGE